MRVMDKSFIRRASNVLAYSADSSKPYVSIPQAVAPDYDIIPQSTVKPNKRIKSKEVECSAKACVGVFLTIIGLR